MDTNKSDRLYEKERLDRTIEIIEQKIGKALEAKQKFKSDIISTQRSMRNDVNPTPTDIDDLANIWQYQADIEQQGHRFRFADQQIKRLEKMLQSPYFARIDFNEDGSSFEEVIYIGIHSLMNDKTGELIVYDWRAPVSSMFYDYETGRAMYISPTGTVEGDLLLKRQYRIKNGKLEYMFDCSLKIDDEILQDVLGRSADSRMKTIVTTIQREQNRVIRNDSHRLLIVQGPAGSGKTSIALHRIAYLLYRYRKSVNAENIVIFSPNKVFNDYISSVLPELGEENVQRTTFFDYTGKILGIRMKKEEMSQLMEYVLTGHRTPEYEKRIESLRYKTSMDFLRVLRNYIKYLEEEGMMFCDLVHNGKKIISSEEIIEMFHKDYKFLPLYNRLQKIRQRLFYLLEPVERRRMEQVMLELADSGNYVNRREIKARSTLLVREEFRTIRESIEGMTDFNLIDTYLKLFEDLEFFCRMCDGNIPSNLQAICDKTIDDFSTNRLSYEDLAPLVLLNISMGDIPDSLSIKHVVIDEVQDYTPVQLEVFRLLFKDARLTMLGDVNQSINPYTVPVGAEGISRIFNMDNSLIINLSKSYRSTEEISAFCRSLLLNKDQGEYIGRKGVKPRIIRACSQSVLYENVKQDIGDLQKGGNKSIAVICKSALESARAYKQLSQKLDIRLIKADDEEYNTGTVVVPSYLAKGLEFDAVLVLNESENGYDPERERNLLYTVCTRALHVLHIYYDGTLPAFLEHLDLQLYLHSEIGGE